MPFTKEMEDIYFYGIQRAADASGFICNRVDKESFAGDILQRIKTSIESSAVVVADLSGANPNVYLEVGYAWGKGVPTILLAKDTKELSFNVRGQRCLQYDSIRSLEELLTRELEQVKSNGFSENTTDERRTIVTVKVVLENSGKPVKGSKVSIALSGIVGKVTNYEYTDDDGEAYFDIDPSDGEIYVDGSLRYKGRVSGRIVVYI
jgi:hypothetical protein